MKSDWYPQRLTAADLMAFVEDAVEHRVFLGQEVQPFEEIAIVFPAMAFLTRVSQDARDHVGIVYEKRERAVGQTPNGNPVFDTASFMHREDWFIARDLIAAAVVKEGMMS